MDNHMKASQTRSRPLPSNEELLSQIRLLLDSPEDDLQAAISLLESKSLAEALDIHGTPAFVIGNQVVPGAVDLDALKGMVADARKK